MVIADDGSGMSDNALVESLRFGSRRDYGPGDLGRYGLGLKTASLSQARRVTVVTRRAKVNRRISVRCLDLDLILDFDEWLVIDPGPTETVRTVKSLLDDSTGTVVVWEQLDRVLPERNPSGGWARRRMDLLTNKTIEHLSMVFHRFLGDRPGRDALTISVNGEKLRPWDPFATDEPATVQLAPQRFELQHGEVTGQVTLNRYVLPGRERFSSNASFERMSGPLKWNRQQGLYIYRADRLVQWGGWAGIRAIDEHTKLARASIDFDTDLDTAFNINVAKMRVSLPSSLRKQLEQPIHEACLRANDAYRKASKRGSHSQSHVRESPSAVSDAGMALKSAALEAGEYEALKRIATALRKDMPEIAKALGF